MALYELEGKSPQLGSGAWVADNAQVIGDVVLGDNASVCWPLRAGRGPKEPSLPILGAHLRSPPP